MFLGAHVYASRAFQLDPVENAQRDLPVRFHIFDLGGDTPLPNRHTQADERQVEVFVFQSRIFLHKENAPDLRKMIGYLEAMFP